MNSAITTTEEAQVLAVKAAKWNRQAIVAIAAVVILSLASNVFTIVGRNDEAKANGVQLDRLTVQLADAQAQVAAAVVAAQTSADETAAATKTQLDTAAAQVECVTRFTYAIQAASSELLASIGALVVVISQTVPGPDRDAAVGDGVTIVDNAVVAYRETVRQRIDYDAAGSPLPCPLEPG